MRSMVEGASALLSQAGSGAGKIRQVQAVAAPSTACGGPPPPLRG